MTELEKAKAFNQKIQAALLTVRKLSVQIFHDGKNEYFIKIYK